MTENSVQRARDILRSITGRSQAEALARLSNELRELLEVAKSGAIILGSVEATINAICRQTEDIARFSESEITSLQQLADASRQTISNDLRSLSHAFAEYIGSLRTDVLNQTETLSGKLQSLEEKFERLSLTLESNLGSASEVSFATPSSKATRSSLGLNSGIQAPALYSPASLDVFPRDVTLSDISDGKVVIFGLQKAGNTWLLSLLSEALGLPAFFNVHDPAQKGLRAVVSTHDPMSEAICTRADFVHGVCLIRDLRDMIASYFHYMQTDSYQKDVRKAHYADVETFYFDWFLSRMVPAHRYQTYWEEYASAGVPVLRYERLVLDTARELRRLFARWGEQVDEEKLKAAVAANDFSLLKRSGRKIGQTQIDASHFRRGGIGSYKDELPQTIIDDINVRFGDVLRRWGYSVP